MESKELELTTIEEVASKETLPNEDENLGRKVYLNQPQDVRFISNHISNTKYNILTFLPKNLYEQFRRIANVYFLIISILASIPAVSPFGAESFWGALIFVLACNAIKEAYEDYVRYKQDKSINNSISLVLKNGEWKQVYWEDMVVGDIVKVEKDHSFPADLFLLASSFENGQCYVETLNLDGETNLKTKQALEVTSKVKTPEDLSNLSGVLKCEDPNPVITKFHGGFKSSNSDKWIPAGLSQLLMSGTVLRNTEWIYGLIIYTGHETKYQMNASGLPSKRSRVERTMNKIIIGLFGVLAFITLLCAIVGGIREKNFKRNAWYLELTDDLNLAIFLKIFTFFLLFNGIVPLALYVTVELVRVGQKYFLDRDILMYHEETDTPAQCRNSNLNEELGQVRYIMSDKTGTLTSNKMDLRMVSIHGKKYGTYLQNVQQGIVQANLIQQETLEKKEEIQFFAPDMNRILSEGGQEAEIIKEFFRVLSLCHSALPDHKKDSKNRLIYTSSSPDEIALIIGAREANFTFIGRTTNSLTINVLGVEETYELLQTLEFSSDRKRMSVICRCPDGKVKLFIKGADSVIFERLTSEKKWEQETNNDLTDFAVAGLRTLVIGVRELDPSIYDDWNKRYYEVSKSLRTTRDKEIDELASEIEHEITLIGGTGIEDKLQDGVPEAIETLLEAGIKIWVLTGDKRETAVNIGRSCKLISNKKQITFNSETEKETAEQISQALEKIKGSEEDWALILSGKAINYCLESLKPEFLTLVKQIPSVIFCRATPLQKALVVNLIRESEKDVVTLAVGDGANDVPMIQSAHVGVGIKGKEGSQAVLASDYSLGQFRFLTRLLLVHGRWSYRRMSMLIFYIFYKQLAVTTLQFWFCLMNGFSGTTLYDENLSNGYNILFSSTPIIAFSVLDQDIPDYILLKYPRLYRPCQNDLFFNQRVFWSWVALGIYNSAVNYFFSVASLDVNHSNGHTASSHWFISLVVYTITVFVVNIKIGMEMSYWTAFHHGTVWGSICFWILFVIGMCSYPSGAIYGVIFEIFKSPTFYFILLLNITVCLAPDFIVKYGRRVFFPTSSHIAQEIAKKEPRPKEMTFGRK